MAYPGGSARDYAAEFFRPYGRLLRRVPLMPTPGNHDLRPRSVYRDLFAPAADGEDAGGPHYGFDWGAAHLVSVSSPEFGRDGAPGAGWLAADLAAAAGRPWRIVFLHEPPYSGGAKFTVAGLRANLEPILERGRADLVLAGHEHLYERSMPACAYAAEARTLHVVSGGGGANLDPVMPHPNFPRAVSVTHYLRIRVTPARLDVRAVDVSGASRLAGGQVTERTLRAPSVVLAGAVVLLVFLAGLAWGGADVGTFAALVLATTPQFLTEASDRRVDMTLTAALTGAQVSLVQALGARRGARLVLAVCLALAMLAKGPVGPGVVGLTALAFAACERRLRPILGLV